MTDEIALTIPRAPAFDGVAHLVLGGLGVRLNLTLEHLEDLQIALASLLDSGERRGDVTVALSVREGEIDARVGPLPPQVLDALEQEGDELDLRRVLDTTVDDVLVQGDSVCLTKKVASVDG
jgi:hypothetical protein